MYESEREEKRKGSEKEKDAERLIGKETAWVDRSMDGQKDS